MASKILPVNKFILLLLLGLATTVLLVPFVQMDDDLIKTDIFVSDHVILLKSSIGQLELPVPGDDIYSSDDPYDFFPELIDPSSIQRIELVPYGDKVSCNVLTSTGKRIAGHTDFCLILSLKLGIPAYVHRDLFEVPGTLITGSLQV